MPSVLDYSLLYDHLQISTIPLVRPGKVPPKGLAWTTYQNRRADAGQLREWFSSDRRNIGIVTGKVSGGLAVRDFDSIPSYERWKDAHPSQATLPTVRSARGYHVYALMDASQTITFSDGELRYGTYVVAPPSVHESGITYEWVIPPGDGFPVVDLETAGLAQDWGINTDNTVGAEYSGQHSNTSHSVLSVCSVLLSEQVRLAITRTLPPGPKRREGKLFELARELKGIPEIAGLAVNDLKPVIQEWHRQALPHINTKPFTDSWLDFKRKWPKVKYPKGTDPISQAFTRSLTTAPPAICSAMDSPQVVALVKLCAELQKMAGDKPFFLACRTAGELIGVDYTTAWKWLDGLCADDILRRVSSGSQSARKANEYRFLPPLT